MNRKKIILGIIIIISILLLVFSMSFFLKERNEEISPDDNLISDPQYFKIGDNFVGKPDIVTEEKCSKMENETQQKNCYDQLQFYREDLKT